MFRAVSPDSHQEGIEEHLAELPIGNPGLTISIGLERSNIDMNRTTPNELDVVRSRIDRHPAVGKCLPGGTEFKFRRVQQHRP